MTDRYTELVKQAYEAQQAREGDGYQKLTCELSGIDGQLASLAHDRERVVAALESMDDAVEAAKEALDAYFAGRDEADVDNDELFEADEPTNYGAERSAGMGLGAIDDEFSTPRANGALTD